MIARSRAARLAHRTRSAPTTPVALFAPAASRPRFRAVAALRVALVALLGAATLTACTEKPDAELVFISTAPHKSLDPQKASWMNDARILSQLYEPLVRIDFSTLEVEPAAAESWTISDDGRVYTFTLRDDAKWSNGDPVRADDFVAAWQRVLLPDSAADYSKKLFPIEGAKAFFDWRANQLEQFAAVRQQAGGQAGDTAQDAADTMWTLAATKFAEEVGIEAVDDRTLRVTLNEPVPYFLQSVSLPVFYPIHSQTLPEISVTDAGTGLRETDAGYFVDPDRLVTNGPYRLAGRSLRQWLHMEANEHYHSRDAVGPDSIREDIISDVVAAEQAFSRGNADWFVSVPSAHSVGQRLVEAAEAGDRDDVYVQPLAGTYFYNFNCLPEYEGEPNPFADARVRRAFSMAINRRQFVERVRPIGQEIAVSFVPPFALRDYMPPIETGIAFDPETAADLLAESGYPGGEGLDGLTLIYNTGHGHEDVAQYVRSQWEQHLGVVVTTEGVDNNRFGERLDNQQFQIARAGWIGDYPDPTTFLNKMASDSENNDSKYASEAYDNLLEQAAAATDPAIRRARLREAEAVLLRDAPMAYMFHYVTIDLAKPWLADIERNEWGRWRMWEFPDPS